MNNSFVSKDVAVEVAVVFAKAPYIDAQKTSQRLKNNIHVTRLRLHDVVYVLFFGHLDVILQYRRTGKCNLFVKHKYMKLARINNFTYSRTTTIISTKNTLCLTIKTITRKY